MPAPRLVVAAALVAALALPATAAAVPPLNDNYLQSTVATNDSQTLSLPSVWTDPQPPNTAEATEQADLFNPDLDGNPGSGGGAEPLSCDGISFTKTVWYDLHPPTYGGVELMPSGFDMAVAVYEYNRDSRLTKLVDCRNAKATTTEDVLFEVEKGRQYTVQIGGVNGASGQLAFELLYFRDSDNDDTLDAAPDECPGIRGTRSDGCPPTLSALPRYATTGSSPITLTRLSVEGVAKGAKVEVTCSRCGRKFTKTARRRGTVNVKSFVGRALPAGDKLVVRITHRATGKKKGKYRFGAIGKYYSYAVQSDGIGKRTTRCLNPGSRKPVKCQG